MSKNNESQNPFTAYDPFPFEGKPTFKDEMTMAIEPSREFIQETASNLAMRSREFIQETATNLATKSIENLIRHAEEASPEEMRKLY